MSFALGAWPSIDHGDRGRPRHRAGSTQQTDQPKDQPIGGLRGAAQVIALQRLAGNRATSGLVAVQRCGSIPSDECPCHDAEPSGPAQSGETRDQGLTGPGVVADEEPREQPVIQRSTTWNGAAVHAVLSPLETALGTGDTPVTWEVLNGSVVKSGAAAAAAIKEPTVSVSGSGSAFSAKVDTVPAQTAGADETVLGAGPWTKTITKAQAGAVTGLPACTGAGNSVFSVKGSPSDQAVTQANRRHEDHHVSDHKANFQAIVAAWDTKVQDAKDKGTEFKAASGQAAQAALWAAMGGTAGAVATKWFDEDGKSGAAFHATPAGGPMSLSNPKAGAGCATSSVDVTNPS